MKGYSSEMTGQVAFWFVCLFLVMQEQGDSLGNWNEAILKLTEGRIFSNNAKLPWGAQWTREYQDSVKTRHSCK